jgi:hypothetical protein
MFRGKKSDIGLGKKSHKLYLCPVQFSSNTGRSVHPIKGCQHNSTNPHHPPLALSGALFHSYSRFSCFLSILTQTPRPLRSVSLIANPRLHVASPLIIDSKGRNDCWDLLPMTLSIRPSKCPRQESSDKSCTDLVWMTPVIGRLSLLFTHSIFLQKAKILNRKSNSRHRISCQLTFN